LVSARSKPGAVQHEKQVFSVGAAVTGSFSRILSTVFPSPFGYCSVEMIGIDVGDGDGQVVLRHDRGQPFLRVDDQ
jgi:3-dehydroquinate dehydratase